MERDPHFVAGAPGKQLGIHREAQAIDHKTALHFVREWRKWPILAVSLHKAREPNRRKRCAIN
jgi:hypothetical protein